MGSVGRCGKFSRSAGRAQLTRLGVLAKENFGSVCAGRPTTLRVTDGTLGLGHSVLLTGPRLSISGLVIKHCGVNAATHRVAPHTLKARGGG